MFPDGKRIETDAKTKTTVTLWPDGKQVTVFEDETMLTLWVSCRRMCMPHAVISAAASHFNMCRHRSVTALTSHSGTRTVGRTRCLLTALSLRLMWMVPRSRKIQTDHPLSCTRMDARYTAVDGLDVATVNAESMSLVAVENITLCHSHL